MGNYRLKLTPTEATFNEEGGYLDIIASVEQPDRDGEIVVPRTLRLDQYRKNPVVLMFHDQKQLPIAKCEDPQGNFTCRLDEHGRLRQRWYFADTPEGRLAASLYRQKVLRGASIGFLDDGLEDVPPHEAERLYGVRRRLRRYIGGDLMETSAVPVPSCPGALALGWVDAPAARAVVSRGGLPGLVTKAFAPYRSIAQATRKAKVSLVGRLTASLRGAAVSTTATDDKAKLDRAVSDAVAVIAKDAAKADATKAAADLAKKDMATTDDTAGGATVGDPHDQVKAGLMAGLHTCIEKFAAGEISWDEAKAAMDSYAEDHGKYSEGGGEGEEGETVEKDDDGDDEEETKAFLEMVKKAVREEVAPLAETVSGIVDTLDKMTQ